MRYWLISFIVVILLSTSVQAQDDLPFPPESLDIFSPAVEIIDMQLSSTIFGDSEPIVVSMDYLAVITRDGDVFPFPDEFAAIPFAQQGQTIYSFYAGNRVFLGTEATYGGSVSQHWMLELETGTYTQLNERPVNAVTPCGTLPFDAIPADNFMIITGADNQQFVCNLLTGIFPAPLPEGFDTWELVPSSRVDYVILSAHPADAPRETATLFALELSTNELITVGEYSRSDHIRVSGMFATDAFYDGNSFLLLSYENYQEFKYTYWVNLSELRIFQIPNGGGVLPNLTTNYWSSEETAEGTISQFTIINLRTEEVITHTFDPACHSEMRGGLNEIYYCRVFNADGTAVDVTSVNVVTGERRVLYTGEVEKIDWISPNGRYGVFLVDDNGIVETLAPDYRNRTIISGNARKIVVDLTTGSQVYEIAAYRADNGSNWMPFTYYVADGWIGFNDFTNSTLVHVEGDPVTTSNIQDRVIEAIDNNWVVVSPSFSANRINSAPIEYSVYNLETQERIPLVDLSVNAHYYVAYSNTSLGFEYLGDGVFELSVGYYVDPASNENAPLYDIATYQIRVPEILAE